MQLFFLLEPDLGSENKGTGGRIATIVETYGFKPAPDFGVEAAVIGDSQQVLAGHIEP
jgi:hypothetical protein